MTATTMNAQIGRLVYLEANGMRFACIVRDVKRAYGKERFELEPVAGGGQSWVNASSVHPVPEAEAKVICR
jgi:hypothetical protein